MYCKPKITVYDAIALKELQACAASCSGGSVGTLCTGVNVGAPEVSCNNGSVGIVICKSGSIGQKNNN